MRASAVAADAVVVVVEVLDWPPSSVRNNFLDDDFQSHYTHIHLQTHTQTVRAIILCVCYGPREEVRVVLSDGIGHMRSGIRSEIVQATNGARGTRVRIQHRTHTHIGHRRARFRWRVIGSTVYLCMSIRNVQIIPFKGCHPQQRDMCVYD